MELEQKKRMYDLLKQVQASQGDYRAAVCIYREKIRKAKVLLELMLTIVLIDKKNLKHVNSKWMSKENVVLTLDDHLTSRDEEKAEAFNAFFQPQFLVSVMDLGLPGPLNCRTVAERTVTFHL